MPRACCPSRGGTAAGAPPAAATVRFPREHASPGFLLADRELSFQLDPTRRSQAICRPAHGLTSDPSLYGRPTLFEASAPGRPPRAPCSITCTPTARDTAGTTVQGVRLPLIQFAVAADRLDPGQGTAQLGSRCGATTIPLAGRSAPPTCSGPATRQPRDRTAPTCCGARCRGSPTCR